jgi:ring-1,2-phenylacetyl-CoA epoxidase subunit PaaA
MTKLAQGNEAQQRMAQDAVDRWWWPSLMMFGPPDSDSSNSDELMTWKVKRETNDALRQQFIDRTVPQADFLGLKIPDPDLKWNEEKGHYDFGEIDWDEFWKVLKGKGPCNKERMRARTKADKEGHWVRAAADAYAAKKAKEKEVAA